MVSKLNSSIFVHLHCYIHFVYLNISHKKKVLQTEKILKNTKIRRKNAINAWMDERRSIKIF